MKEFLSGSNAMWYGTKLVAVLFTIHIIKLVNDRPLISLTAMPLIP